MPDYISDAVSDFIFSNTQLPVPQTPTVNAAEAIESVLPSFPDSQVAVPVPMLTEHADRGDSFLPNYANEYFQRYILNPEERVLIFHVCPFVPHVVPKFYHLFPYSQISNQMRVLERELREWQHEFQARYGRRPDGNDKRVTQAKLVLYHLMRSCLQAWAAVTIQSAWRGHCVRRQVQGPRLPMPQSPVARQVNFAADPLGSVFFLLTRARQTGGRAVPPRPEQAPQSFEDCLADKADLKQILRQYDEWFEREHGRPPSRADKEALRPAYFLYHSLKGRADKAVTRSSVDSSQLPQFQTMAPLDAAKLLLADNEDALMRQPPDVLAARRKATNHLLRTLKQQYNEGIARQDETKTAELQHLANVYHLLMQQYGRIKSTLV